jgi:protein-tyrosine-phosphatase
VNYLTESLNSNFGGKKGFVLTLRDVFFGGFFVKREFHRRLNPASVTRVVFVCQGNICRSALAEVIFKSESNLPVRSIGLDTKTGKEANPRMVKTAKDFGFDLTEHRATNIDDFNFNKSDLLVCMQPEHIKMLNGLGLRNQKILLGAFHKSIFRIRIPDPYSANDSYMKKCAEIVINATKNVARKYD